jgi:ferredoxin
MAENGWEIQDDDLFAKAEAADLDDEDYGVLEVDQGEYILDAAEDQGFHWPFYCREGKCAVCAAQVIEGDVDMDTQEVISDAETADENVRLTCVGTTIEEGIKIIYRRSRPSASGSYGNRRFP